MANETATAIDLHVLIVDDDLDDLAMLSDSFRSLSGGHWKIQTADGVAKALHSIAAGKIQLVVVAVNSAALDVSLLLGSFGQHPSKFKTVVLAAAATAEIRAASLAGGADLFFEKPVSPEGLKAVFASVSELAGWTLPPDFQAPSHGVSLADLIHMECMARNSSLLELFREHSLGRIYIEDGQIIHAVCGEISGERAFQNLFALADVTFELHDFELPPARTINRSWEHLLGALTRAQQAAQLATTAEVYVPRDPTATLPGQTVELLICSAAGEVLYQWQCADTTARLTLLQEINQRAEQIISYLQPGKLDRLEVKLTDGRAILQLRADRLVFARITHPKEKHEG